MAGVHVTDLPVEKHRNAAAPGTGTAVSGWKTMDDWSSAKLCDVANLFLGMMLFFSPWLFDLPAGAPWQTASIVGLLIAVLSIAALAAFAEWEEWLNLVAGLWLIVSPWALDFGDGNAITIDVAIGLTVAVLAAFEIWLMHPTGSRIKASH
jgi:hypothetical protein